MIIIVCIDENNGMLFNHRRQSQDRLLRKNLLQKCQGRKLYMDVYSYSLFAKDEFFSDFSTSVELSVSDDFFLQAEWNDFCFMERMDDFLSAAATNPILLNQIQAVLFYHWNRTYPADFYFPLDLTEENWILTEREEFIGSSHDRITRELYKKTS